MAGFAAAWRDNADMSSKDADFAEIGRPVRRPSGLSATSMRAEGQSVAGKTILAQRRKDVFCYLWCAVGAV